MPHIIPDEDDLESGTPDDFGYPLSSDQMIPWERAWAITGSITWRHGNQALLTIPFLYTQGGSPLSWNQYPPYTTEDPSTQLDKRDVGTQDPRPMKKQKTINSEATSHDQVEPVPNLLYPQGRTNTELLTERVKARTKRLQAAGGTLENARKRKAGELDDENEDGCESEGSCDMDMDVDD